MSSMVEPIYFYSKTDPFSEFTNFARFGFEADGVFWPTAEHYYQAQKFPDDPSYQERIRKARSPRHAQALYVVVGT